MSEQSYLEKLLDGAEVEWLPLGQIAKKIYSGGTPDTKKNEYWENGNIPWMSSGEVNLKIVYETEKFITETGLKNSSAKFVPKNSIVMALAGQGKTRGKVARTRIDLTTNQSLAAITLDEKTVCSDYIFHFLETQYEALRQLSSGNSGRGGLNLQMISAYKVPIPCPNNPEKSLAIQSEIVRILDKFTALTAELTAELTARKKQYSYYRDQLLSFEDVRAPYLEKLLDGAEVEWRKLSDLVDLRRGRVMSKGYLVDNIGRYPVYSSQTANNGMIGSIDTFDFDGEFVSWTTDGANAGTVFYRTGKFSITNVCGLIKINDSSPLNYKYLFYWLTIEAKSHVYSGMGNPKLMSHQVEKIPVPIPCPGDPEKSLAIQSEIVRILDKFDTLTSSISEGLPREIELRQKQYEYYRDLLFSFPKPESVTN